MSYRLVGPPAFLAGVAAAYVAFGGRRPPDVSALAGGPPNGLPVLAAWVVIGLVASFGWARVTTQLLSNSPPRLPSMLGCSIACALGGMAVTLLPDGGLWLLDRAGALLMLYLALGLLAGLVDMALRINQRSPTK